MIELRAITKRYGDTIILQNANYTFPNKGLVCLLGESGCGKTSLMRILAGLDNDYTGSVFVDQEDISTLSEDHLCDYRKDYIGFIFQDYQLLRGYSVIENAVYPCVLNNKYIQNNIDRAKDILNDLGLSDKINENVENLSGGQKQRVAIARALIKQPKIILADEPTGAVDRKTSTEIMELLKEISETKLVVVITHDHRICEYADEIITIQNKNIYIQKSFKEKECSIYEKMKLYPPKKINYFQLAYKNFSTAFFKYLLISCVFSIGILCMICSLSSGNIVKSSISNFKEKNVSLYNGYIKKDPKQDIYEKLANDNRLENVYKQYMIENVTLSMNSRVETMAEKYPMPKTKEAMSYGAMPRNNKNEISLTPSLAKKFDQNIKNVIGEQLTLQYKDQTYVLTVCGIFNAGYDDFFVSSDLEKRWYQGLDDHTYSSINYDVKNFEDIVKVSDELANANIHSENASEQVKTMQDTFSRVQTLFIVISCMILLVAICIVVIILMKMRSVRYQLVGLLYSFGFHKSMVSNIIMYEAVLLTGFIVIVSSLLFIGISFITYHYQIDFGFTILDFINTILISGGFLLVINYIINRKLINTRPNIALQK